MDKKNKIVKIFCIFLIVLGLGIIGLGVFLSVKPHNFENKTQNAVMNLELYGTTIESVNLYKKPGINSKVLANIEVNQEVTILSSKTYTDEENREFYKVLYITNEGKTLSGYIETSKLKLNNQETEEEVSVEKIILGVNEEKDIELDYLSPDQTWEIENNDILSINNNKIKGLKVGTSNISTTINDKELVIKVIIEELEINIPKEITVGENLIINGKILPEEEADEEIEYTSSDISLLSIEGNTITAKKAGTVIITANTENISKQISLTIKDDIKEFELKTNKTTYNVGSKTQISSTIDSKLLNWESSNKDIATVNNKGIVLFKKAGNVTIEADYKGIVKHNITFKVENETTVAKIHNDKANNTTAEIVDTNIFTEQITNLNTGSPKSIVRPLQQFDVYYNYNNEKDIIDNWYPEKTYYFYQYIGGQKVSDINNALAKGAYENVYNMHKSVYTMKNLNNNEYKKITHSNGGHGMVFSPVAYDNDSIYAYTDFDGFIFPKSKDTYMSGSLKANIFYINFNNVNYGETKSFYNSNSINSSSNGFNNNLKYKSSINFGLAINRDANNTKYSDNDAIKNIDNNIRVDIKTGYKNGKISLNYYDSSSLAPLAYDKKSQNIAAWTKGNEVQIFNYKNIKNEIIRVNRNSKKTSVNNTTISNISTPTSKCTKANLFRQGVALYNNILYLLWSSPSSVNCNKPETHITAYNVSTKKIVLNEDIDIRKYYPDGQDFEAEGIQVMPIDSSGQPYIHIGMAYKVGNKGGKHSDIIRLE